MAIPDKPLNRIEKYLAKWAGDTVSIPAEPLNRLEKYLAKIVGQNVQTPTPLCRIEDYLDAIIGNIQWTEITNQSVATFTSAIAAELSKLEIAITPVQSGSGDPAPDNVRPITGWTQAKIFVETAYDASATPKAVIDLGGTIYGGTLDVTTGVLTVTHGYYALDPNGDWSRDASATNGVMFSLETGRTLASVEWRDTICNTLVFGTGLKKTSPSGSFWFTSGGAIRLIYGTTGTATLDEFKTWLTSTPTYFVYPLVTAQTVQLTPAQVETLVGANAVWADTGDILTLKYREA